MTDFIHIADTHLGKVAFNKTTPDGSNLRETLIYENFLAAIEAIIDLEPEAVIHAGDLFDTVKPKTKSLLVALQALDMLKEARIPFVAIAGNHSMQKNSYTTSAFEILKKAHPECTFAYSFKYENVKIGDTLFHLIPNLLHQEDYKAAALDATCYNRANQYHAKCNHVLVTHGLADTIPDKRLSTVAEFELTPEVLLQSYDYIAGGHVHNQMRVGTNMHYSGSLEYLTYGEMEDVKGGLLVNPEKHTVEHIDLPHCPMVGRGVVDCFGKSKDDIIDAIASSLELCNSNNSMYQITLDFGDDPIKAIASSELVAYTYKMLDLKLRVRSNELQRTEIKQQDLHAINYITEFEKFLQQRQLTEQQKVSVLSRGTDTLKTVMANHSEVLE
jgi:DNA repair exonuclease SbcCD nuclease subunit